MWTNTQERYGLVSRALHWTLAALILVLIGLGWWMTRLSFYDPWYHRAPDLHKALGLAALGLGLSKIVWAFISPAPPLAATLKVWERGAAMSVHKALFALMLILPITGYVISTSQGAPVSLFGLAEIPALLPKSEPVRDAAILVHYWLAYGGAALIGVHVLAALKHALINRDGTLRRMI